MSSLEGVVEERAPSRAYRSGILFFDGMGELCLREPDGERRCRAETRNVPRTSGVVLAIGGWRGPLRKENDWVVVIHYSPLELAPRSRISPAVAESGNFRKSSSRA